MDKSNKTVLYPREAGSFISKNCEDVKIDDAKIRETAEVLASAFQRANFSLEGWKNHTLHPKVADESSIDFIFVADVLNFSFWPDVPGKKFKVQYGGKDYTGYWSLIAALNRAKDAGKPVLDAKFMANVSEDEFKELFRSDSDVEIPLLQERLEGYRQSGSILLEKFGGTFVNCVRKCNKDATALLRVIVENFPSFRDEAVFKGQHVAFYKRAQILVADIWCCFEGKGLGEFKNIGELTMFADYRVPQSLEYFGILQYSSGLKTILQARTVLPPGDRYELEIRGTSIESIERLTKEVHHVLAECGVKEEMLRRVNAVTVDNFLWDYARDHREKMDHLAFHLVRTIYY